MDFSLAFGRLWEHWGDIDLEKCYSQGIVGKDKHELNCKQYLPVTSKVERKVFNKMYPMELDGIITQQEAKMKIIHDIIKRF